MKLRQTVTPVLVLLGIVIVSGCSFITVETPVPTPDIAATAEAAVAAALASQPTPDVAATAEAAVAAALASQPAPDIAATAKAVVATEIAAQADQEPTVVKPETVALISYHGRYVIAMGEDGDWLLRQEPDLSDCGQFTLQHLDGGKVALVTCHGRYVTAPGAGDTRLDWALRQEPQLGDCGRFILHDLGDGKVAFETCADRYITAADASWGQELQWLVIAQTYRLDFWEMFALQR